VRVLIDREGQFVCLMEYTQLPVVSVHRRLQAEKRNKPAEPIQKTDTEDRGRGPETEDRGLRTGD